MFKKSSRPRTATLATAAIVAAAMLVPTAASGAPASGAGHQAPDPSGDRQSSNSARAAASFRALQANLGTTDGSGLYREQYSVEAGDNAYSYEWPFSQVHIAIAVAALFVPAAASASPAPPAPSHSTPGEPPASVATANAKSAAGVLMASYDPEKAWWPSSWWNSAVALQTIEGYLLRTGTPAPAVAESGGMPSEPTRTPSPTGFTSGWPSGCTTASTATPPGSTDRRPPGPGSPRADL